MGRVAPMVGVEDLVAVEQDLDRAARFERERRAGDLVRQRVGLAAESAADLRFHHPDSVHRDPQHLGERPMKVVRNLGRAPDGESPVGRCFGDGALRLGEGMGDPGERRPDAHRRRGRAEGGVDVAEMLDHLLLHVRVIEPFLVDRHVDALAADPRVRVLGERFDLDLDGRQCALGGPFVLRGHGRDDVADVSGAIHRDGGLVLGDR